jgi:hypothetical protein
MNTERNDTGERKNEKEGVVIDVYMDEFKRGKFYRIVLNGRLDDPPTICDGGGYFLNEDDLEEFLAENSDYIEVVKDYRK